MENLIYPFSYPIYHSSIDKKNFLKIENDVKDYIKNNINLFTKQWDCPTLSTAQKNLSYKEIIKSKTLNDQIKIHVEKYFKAWKFKLPCDISIHELWVNLGKKGSYQEAHHHHSVLFSGTIYINVDNTSGDFVLYNPLNAESILMHCSKTFTDLCQVTPKNSDIIIFPGWLRHRVAENKSNLNRISLTFNIKANFK